MNKAQYNAVLKYESACYLIVEAFSEKQNLTFDFWVSDEIGSIACFNSMYFFTMDDMVYDLKTERPKNMIIEWHEASTDAHLREEKPMMGISYPSWCNGSRF
jgi:hypothetical protein